MMEKKKTTQGPSRTQCSPPVSYPLTKRQRVPRLPSEFQPDFGQMLHGLRGKGMSIEALSMELGCSREALYSLLTGRVEDTKYSIGRGIIRLWKLSTGSSLPLFLEK